MYGWESSNALEVGTVRWVRSIAQDLAFPADIGNVAQYIRDVDHLLIKNYPEFRCFRDVCFYFKLFLNPQLEAFPSKAPYSQRQAQLTFYFYQQHFYVGGYATGGAPQLLSAKPRVRRGEVTPLHRFSSRADPNAYTRPTRIEGEDDLLHMWELPDFGDEKQRGEEKSAKIRIFAGDCVEEKKPSTGPGGFEGSGCAVSGFLFRV